MTAFTVAIMQPYFFPYAGYFRLLAASDLFVIYDCVQFPRRGWVHRNKLKDASGEPRWLTLPLEKAPQSVLIQDLRFPPDAADQLAERVRPFPLFTDPLPALAPILSAVSEVHGAPVDYIERLLEMTAAYCGLPWRTVRSSTLGLSPELHGQDRILEIARRVGATHYVNASGGRELYDALAFEKAGIELRFLIDYAGPTASILQRMADDERGALSAEIKASSVTG